MTLITETRRLQITPLSFSDIPLLHELTGDVEVMRYFPKVLNYAETSKMMEKILEHYGRYGHCFWKVIGKSTGDFIGIAGILHQEIENTTEDEVSYRIMRSYWHNGFATEAAEACMKYAKTTLGKTRLISIIHPENTASLRVAEKLGARKEKSVCFIGTTHYVYVY